MNGRMQDRRFGLRQPPKNPGFPAVAGGTLPPGIGANTAICRVVKARVLKLLPDRDPQQLVVVGDPTRAHQCSDPTPRTDVFSHPLYREPGDRNSVFSGRRAGGSNHHIEIVAAVVRAGPEGGAAPGGKARVVGSIVMRTSV